ncbi:unnamed protein product [marine sediment metagenome]|uniref:Uncharacterized protein n=1 Tax=marine sediment metagenome TaxID=412755 RepID=X0SHH2_9ZZZZ
MSENIRYRIRLGDYEQELEIPVSQFSNKIIKFTDFFLDFLKQDLTSEDKETKKDKDEQ